MLFFKEPMFFTDFGEWGESTVMLLLKIHRYHCNHTAYECFVSFSAKFNSPSSKNTSIMRKAAESLCDMAYQKYCKIVVSKEVCLHYVNQPL